MRCAVVGAGAWGSALADLLARTGHDVRLWAFEPDVVRGLRDTHQNPVFLPGFTVERSIIATADHREALDGAAIVVYATPSQHLRRVAQAGRAFVRDDAVLAVASKGIEEGTLGLMSDVVSAEVPSRDVVAVSGPSFAAEVGGREARAGRAERRGISRLHAR